MAAEERHEERDDEKGEDCVVCLQQTREKSNQLFLYNCRCVYAIHASCFRDWRRMTETNRICLICREGLESFEDEQEVEAAAAAAAAQPLIVRPVPVRPLYGYGAIRFWLYRADTATKNLCLVGMFMCIVFLIFRHLMAHRPAVSEPLPLRPLGSQNRLLL